ncbi:hypothetical protein CC1G_07226 [Coprinopsis cinerea okayama7|uniref:Calcineurin-like phosphoesterase domain-containing protein n=1 Tax=Coprinopsis cinerea (strain Okayama-7 / 130 / ATCC MYA-4618 / FGSC 9003) TaxID=240176 RepID=A8PD00_COPC7|nr:hypothetical protein CC1G_07226 [Coprinopsis cinerea okayama7\|eukprot:XP_001840496.2 hypothetical protein CC1G_07226 [Coprinopsis cinerea okayama7\
MLRQATSLWHNLRSSKTGKSTVSTRDTTTQDGSSKSTRNSNDTKLSKTNADLATPNTRKDGDEHEHFRRSIDAVVQLEYNEPADLLPLQETEHARSGGHWTRFVCVSDTHDHTFPVPNGDVLLHSGDLTSLGRCDELEKTMEWLYGLPHPVKIIVAGNHDLVLHAQWYDMYWTTRHRRRESTDKALKLLTGKRAKKAGIIYLEDRSRTFSLGPGRRNWTVYGSPWSPTPHSRAFSYSSEGAEEFISSIPNTDILLTHGPPAGVFDYTAGGDLAGCPVLTSHLSSGRLRPRLHVFGHIHEAHGACIHSWENVDGPSKPPTYQNVNHSGEKEGNGGKRCGGGEGGDEEEEYAGGVTEDCVR